MQFKAVLTAACDKLRRGAKILVRHSSLLSIAFGVAVLSLSLAEAAARVDGFAGFRIPQTLAVFTAAPPAQPAALAVHIVWEGADLDGDGQADIANPTGHAPRATDDYGEGFFHAQRDGGARRHEGVDYVAEAGQTVEAPISGYVSKIGYAYTDDQTLRFVEIDNPALHITARAFYVDPSVAVGDPVAVGHPIGHAHSLQRRYGGITDHIHLEIEDRRGRKLDAERLIIARAQTGPVGAN